MHLCITINMVALHSGNRDGVVSTDSQIETVPLFLTCKYAALTGERI